MTPQILPIHFPLRYSNVAGSDSSVLGGNHGDEEPPVARAELRPLEMMERMFNKCLPAAGGQGPQQLHEESGDENSGFGN